MTGGVIAPLVTDATSPCSEQRAGRRDNEIAPYLKILRVILPTNEPHEPQGGESTGSFILTRFRPTWRPVSQQSPDTHSNVC
ncbi:hypothetical protein EYF80_068000 [Liparis tanakae]|uniref:Uncharacterized protein n=1 Tax=Liparis tanakae TaxID=230148 RepID=A0A4Z2DZJ8_9TELE|nr:hypothetical protein EYF80_068000 [Liparis tanakae]